MDQKAKEAQLDAVQWGNIKQKTLDDKRDVWDKIKSITFLYTIEPQKMYMRLEYEDGKRTIWEGGSLTEDGRIEFPKCEVLAETVFKK